MSKRNLIGGVALVLTGATAGMAVMHLKVGFGPTASAAPPTVLADAKPALPPPSKQQLSDARAVGHTFAQVASQLSPSVVRISITKSMKGMSRGNPFRGSPFERFFGEGDDDEQRPSPKQHGTGSGVVIDAKGYILTNNHVVEDADEVKVSFIDGKTVNGKVVGTDPKSDLAVVKVDGVDVKAAKLGDSDKLLVGDWVIAIGNPFGLDHTVTVGVLSAKNRSGMGPTYADFLQTDASINPGNSGGPLVNLEGEVIGINSMIAGMGTGIGFAVPSSMARPIAEQLIQNGKVRRPYLGIRMQDVTPEIAKTLGNKAPDKGAIVGEIDPGTPAAKAGVKAGDVITAVDGQPIEGSRQLQKTVLGKKIGQKVDLAVWRDGQVKHVSAVTAELPGDEHAQRGGGEGNSPKAKLGIGLQSLTPNLAEQLGIDKKTKGAVVTSVRDGSPAAEAGVQQGDVILEVDRRPVGSADEAAKALSENRGGAGHLLRVKRGEGVAFIVIPQS